MNLNKWITEKYALCDKYTFSNLYECVYFDDRYLVKLFLK